MDMTRHNSMPRIPAILTVLVLVAACGGGGAAATPTPTPEPSAASASPSEAPSAEPSDSGGATGPANVAGPATVEAGKQFEVTWTGPNAHGDYVTIVAAGATKWTNEPFFYTTEGSPGKLVAPTKDGAYELWYVSGADSAVLARKSISVTPFAGALLAPDEVQANTTFEVAWNGPNGPGDYVTIVAAGATRWTNESFFYTSAGSPGKLTAPIEPGSHVLWYVTGTDSVTQATRPITVLASAVTLKAATSAQRGTIVEITWTGPNGPGDYITFAPVGSAEGTYLEYAYTTAGSPASVKAPAEPGNYEIRYVAGTGKTLLSLRITIN